jgi:hypothetical protein
MLAVIRAFEQPSEFPASFGERSFERLGVALTINAPSKPVVPWCWLVDPTVAVAAPSCHVTISCVARAQSDLGSSAEQDYRADFRPI